MSEQPTAAQLTPKDLIDNARRLVDTAGGATSREYDTLNALESKLEWGDIDTAGAFAAVRAILNSLGDVANCRGCNATIWWVITRNGKRAPYSASALNHFADCPKAAAFKRKGAR